MARNLIVCCDGTGNQFGNRNSNVVKLYSILARSEDQLGFYDPGVGTFGLREALFEWQKVPAKILGLAFGWGITRQIEEAYVFLMRHYEPGDRIFLFGFSRGAYIARALAGMLHAVGLLYPQHENLIEYASRLYQNLPEHESDMPGFFELHHRFKSTFARECPVHFMGLWDTVTSVGWIYAPTRFPYTTRNPGVHVVRHAVSIDERRCKFRQNLWSPVTEQDVREVWFAGVHSDVGGSYPEPESGLSQITLQWMADQAQIHGMQVDLDALDRMLGREAGHASPDPHATLHRSLEGAWWLAEPFPRRYRDPKKNFRVSWRLPFVPTSWSTQPPFLRWAYIARPRFIPPGAVIHHSVLERRAGGAYAPPNLPDTIEHIEPGTDRVWAAAAAPGEDEISREAAPPLPEAPPAAPPPPAPPEDIVATGPMPEALPDFDYAAAPTTGGAIPDELAEEVVHPRVLKMATPEKAHRSMQCDISESAPPHAPVEVLGANTEYDARIYFGTPSSAQTITATAPLDESRLPPSADGHTLRIVFSPLSRLGGELVSPQEQTLHLPTEGNSTIARFGFATGADPQAFRARVLVLHQARILQTLLLHVDRATGALALDPENTLAATIESAADSVAKPVDVSLLINDNPAGIPGLTVITPASSTFLEPDGLAQSIQLVRELLGELNQRVDSVTALADPALVDVLKDLANYGVTILREIRTQLPLGPLQQAQRVQLVEAVRSAYFPVEFLYDGKAPSPAAVLCPNAVAALREGGVHAECPHKGSREHVCPAAFWGFSKCIERQPFGLQAGHVFSVPQPGADSIAPFRHSIYAASRRVDEAELTSPAGMESVLRQSIAGVLRAGSWAELRTLVGAQQPDFLLLLPHSLDSPDTAGMPALEVSASHLRSSDLDEDYVNPKQSAIGPVVMLLGCSTALTEIPFLNFVREFKRSGASIVLGTLAIIHGSKAVAFVDRFFAELHTLKPSETRTFDELLLQVKRQMLAEGEPFVLSLAAYGHSGWKLKL